MKKYLNYKEAGEMLGVCRNTLMKYNRPGIAIKIGKCVRFDADALVEAIKNENKKGD